MTQEQQIPIGACPDCGLARMLVPVTTAKLAIVSMKPPEYKPCPFCIFANDVKRNMEALMAVLAELQGMANPIIEEAAV